jgi:hypothetical protein
MIVLLVIDRRNATRSRCVSSCGRGSDTELGSNFEVVANLTEVGGGFHFFSS